MLRFTGSLAVLYLASLPLCAQMPIQHAPDGLSRQMVTSIDIPAVPNAPFSAVVVTENTIIMPDGSKRSMWNHRLVARDSSGRVFQERRYLTPTGNVDETPISEWDFADPNRKEMTICHPQTKVCEVHRFQEYFQPPQQNASLPQKVSRPNGVTIENQDLGLSMIQELQCSGSREVMTIPAKLLGSDKPEPVVKEFWYSPQLSLNIITKRFDPRISSIQNFTVTEVNRAEPDPKTFKLPEQYRTIHDGQ